MSKKKPRVGSSWRREKIPLVGRWKFCYRWLCGKTYPTCYPESRYLFVSIWRSSKAWGQTGFYTPFIGITSADQQAAGVAKSSDSDHSPTTVSVVTHFRPCL